MLKTYLIITITAFFAFAGYASHSQSLVSPIKQQPAAATFPHGKWTVLIYMSADNELDKYAMHNIHEMEAAAPAACPMII